MKYENSTSNIPFIKAKFQNVAIIHIKSLRADRTRTEPVRTRPHAPSFLSVLPTLTQECDESVNGAAYSRQRKGVTLRNFWVGGEGGGNKRQSSKAILGGVFSNI